MLLLCQINNTNITTVMTFKLAFDGIILLGEVPRESTDGQLTGNLMTHSELYKHIDIA